MFSVLKKSIFLSILLALFTSCASKTDGKYHTKYSYHPYYSLYATKMSSNTRKKTQVASKREEVKPKRETIKSKTSINEKSRFLIIA